jgi:hypothetical protein
MYKNGCSSTRLLPWLLMLSVLGKAEAQPQVADASTFGNDSRPVLRVGSISVRKILKLFIRKKTNNNKQI